MKNERFKWDSKFVQFIELVVDLFFVFLGFYIVLVIQEGISINSMSLGQSRDLLLSNAFFIIFALIFFRIYSTTIIEKSFVVTVFSVFFALLLSNIASVVGVFFIPQYNYSTMTFVYTIWIQFGLIVLWKYFFGKFINKRIVKVAMIVGLEQEAKELAMKIIGSKRKFISLKYVVFEETDCLTDKTYQLMEEVDQVYLTSNVHERIKEKVIGYCLGNKNKDAVVVPKTYHVSFINSKAYQVADVLTLKVESLHISAEQQFVKRVFDVIVSFLAILLLSPLLVVSALIIKLQDGGPIFFRQIRVTKDDTQFNILKFRSMIPDAEKHTGAVQASEKDPRITRFGKFMRATRIDELPQLFNVLRGEMSIVGPRALRIEEVEDFTRMNSDFRFRANVKSGITGLAQIMGRYGTSSEDKLRLDLVYIRNQSFIGDLIIIAQTAKIVFDRNSARGLKEELPFEEYIKYFGKKVDVLADNTLLVKKVV